MDEPTDQTDGAEATEYVEGTMFQGADGSVYVISDEDLAAFRLNERDAEKMKQSYEQLQEVTGFGLNPGAAQPDFQLMAKGPFARRMGEWCVEPVLHAYNMVRDPGGA